MTFAGNVMNTQAQKVGQNMHGAYDKSKVAIVNSFDENNFMTTNGISSSPPRVIRV